MKPQMRSFVAIERRRPVLTIILIGETERVIHYCYQERWKVLNYNAGMHVLKFQHKVKQGHYREYSCMGVKNWLR